MTLYRLIFDGDECDQLGAYDQYHAQKLVEKNSEPGDWSNCVTLLDSSGMVIAKWVRTFTENVVRLPNPEMTQEQIFEFISSKI